MVVVNLLTSKGCVVEICTLCNRPLGTVRLEDHHLVPKTFGGKVTIALHAICHRSIHATLTERELLNYYHTVDRLLEHEQIQKFVNWVSKKPLDFYVSHAETAQRKGKRSR